MKYKLSLTFLLVCLMFSVTSTAIAANSKDINGHWAQTIIEKWVNSGLVSGYPDGSFKPNKEISRAEFVALVNRAFKKQNKDANCNFTDVKITDWFYYEVASGRTDGYISGYPDGSFKPNKSISRQEAAAIIVILLNLIADGEDAIKTFNDVDKFPAWSKNSINAVVSNKIMNGYPDTTFKPENLITRAEAVVALDKALTTTEVSTPPTESYHNSSSGSGSDSKTITDFNFPEIVITNPKYSVYFTKSPSLNLSGTAYDKEGLQSITYSVDRGSSGNASGITTWSISDVPLEVGSNIIIVTATDLAGNTSTDSIDVTYFSDGTYKNSDSDGDGLSDWCEENIVGTNPSIVDTDGNGISDDVEDPDNDGLSNLKECSIRTDPNSEDTDEDGLKDGKELEYNTDPLNPDTDGDGLFDGDEVMLGFNPLKDDTDGDGILDKDEKTDQVLSNEFVSHLETDDNKAIPNIYLYGAEGNINKSTFVIDDSDNYVYSDIRAVVGKPVDILCFSDFDSARLSFILKDVSNIENFCISNYEEETNKITPLETIADAENNVVSATVEHFSKYFVIDKQTLEYDWDISNDSSIIEKGKADVVFVIDSTGSMSSAIYNVKDNIIKFVNQLEEDKVDVRLGLVEFKDIIEDGPETTKNWGWYINPQDFKNNLDNIIASYGGDEPESAVDGLEEARRMGFRSNVTKFIILITDTFYKEETRFPEVTSMEQEVQLLKVDDIITSVIAPTYYKVYYDELYNETNGIFADINDDFAVNLNLLIDKIGGTVTDGVWIRLSNGTVVKLDKQPSSEDFVTDTDKDGILDSKELIEEISIEYPPGSGIYAKAWTFNTNPANSDTDGDGHIDGKDSSPTNPYIWTSIHLKGVNSGEIVSGILPLYAEVEGPTLKTVHYYVDNQYITSKLSAPYDFNINTKEFESGLHTIAVNGVDANDKLYYGGYARVWFDN